MPVFAGALRPLVPKLTGCAKSCMLGGRSLQWLRKLVSCGFLEDILKCEPSRLQYIGREADGFLRKLKAAQELTNYTLGNIEPHDRDSMRKGINMYLQVKDICEDDLKAARMQEATTKLSALKAEIAESLNKVAQKFNEVKETRMPFFNEFEVVRTRLADMDPALITEAAARATNADFSEAVQNAVSSSGLSGGTGCRQQWSQWFIHYKCRAPCRMYAKGVSLIPNL